VGKTRDVRKAVETGLSYEPLWLGDAISYLANEVRPAVEGWPGNLGSLLIGPQAGAIRPSGEGAGTGDEDLERGRLVAEQVVVHPAVPDQVAGAQPGERLGQGTAPQIRSTRRARRARP
jgi:hypothetical protein